MSTQRRSNDDAVVFELLEQAERQYAQYMLVTEDLRRLRASIPEQNPSPPATVPLSLSVRAGGLAPTTNHAKLE